MVRLETGYTVPSEVVKEDPLPPDTQKNPPHGVDPRTYSLILTAEEYNRDVKDIFGEIDPDDLYITLRYYKEDVSLTDLDEIDKKHRSRPTRKKVILSTLSRLWELVPPEAFPPEIADHKEEVIKIKEDSSRSPHVAEKISKVVTSLWHNSDQYKKKTLEGIKNREPPTQETIIRRAKTMQQIWNKKHGMEENADPLTRKIELFREWLRITTEVPDPSLHDIDRLKKENKTKFSATMYRQEFGDGSFTKAKETLVQLVELERRSRIMTLAGPSFEAAQKLVDYLTSRSKKLAKYGISEEDIQRYNAQIVEAHDKILLATSQEEISQAVERLDLRLSRIKRKISIMTPLSINKGRLRLQSDIP